MGENAGIYAREIPQLGRYVQFGIAGDRVISVSFPESPDEDAENEHDILDQVAMYFEGERVELDTIPVGLTVPTDQRTVLETLRSVPYGEDISVEQLARMTPGLDPEETDDINLVRDTLSNNPLALLVPDHRVGDGPSGAPHAVEQKMRALEGLK